MENLEGYLLLMGRTWTLPVEWGKTENGPRTSIEHCVYFLFFSWNSGYLPLSDLNWIWRNLDTFNEFLNILPTNAW